MKLRNSAFFFWLLLQEYFTMHSPLNINIFFSQNLLYYPLSFPIFTWVALCQLDRSICWNVEALHVRCVSVHRLPQKGFLDVHPSGDHKDGSRRALNRYCSENSREESISFLLMPVCALVLSCKRMTWFIFLFVHLLRIRCSNFFNTRTYRSELIVEHLYKNPRYRGWWTALRHVTSVLITASETTELASNWANFYGILAIQTSHRSVNLYKTQALSSMKFNHISLLSTHVYNISHFRCYCVEGTWLTGVSMILQKFDNVSLWWVR